MAIGIVAEYNPFHQGHAHQIREAKRLYLTQKNSDPLEDRSLSGSTPPSVSPSSFQDPNVIVVMSGCYVQRGEPAFLDPFLRTRMALSLGASLVLSLPTLYATSTAEWFAKGAIRSLYHTGLVDAISFGLEDIKCLPLLQQAARQMVEEQELYNGLLQEALQEESSFASARERALTKMLGTSLPTDPNAILALEYLKEIYRIPGWDPLILPLQREGMGYHSTSAKEAAKTPFVSAAYLRSIAEKGDSILPYLPEPCAKILQEALSLTGEGVFVYAKDIFPALTYRLSQHTPETLREVDEIGEGLENRILRAYPSATSYEDLLDKIKTKRYPTSRLKRILLNIVLEITKQEKKDLSFEDGPSYLRVLGVQKESLSLLSDLSRQASLPLIVNLAKDEKQLPDLSLKMLEKDLRYNRYYQTLSSGVLGEEKSQGLIIL